jgi:hypothetical protein
MGLGSGFWFRASNFCVKLYQQPRFEDSWKELGWDQKFWGSRVSQGAQIFMIGFPYIASKFLLYFQLSHI